MTFFEEVHTSILPHNTDGILKRFEKAITERTKVISVSHVISSTGLRMPIAGIGSLAKRHGIICIVDGAPAVVGMTSMLESWDVMLTLARVTNGLWARGYPLEGRVIASCESLRAAPVEKNFCSSQTNRLLLQAGRQTASSFFMRN